MTTKILRWGDQQKVFGLVKVRIIEVQIIQVFPWEFVRKFQGDRGISFELVKVRIIRIDCKTRESWLYVNCNISCSTWWFPTFLIMCQQVKIIGAGCQGFVESCEFPCVDTCGSISCALVYKLFKTTHTITNIGHNKCFLAIIAKTLGSTHDGRLL